MRVFVSVESNEAKSDRVGVRVSPVSDVVTAVGHAITSSFPETYHHCQATRTVYLHFRNLEPHVVRSSNGHCTLKVDDSGAQLPLLIMCLDSIVRSRHEIKGSR